MSECVRISKYISQCGLMSRRSADKYISDGRVYINDKVAVLGQIVYDGDVVRIDSNVIKPVGDKVYIMLNKPIKVATTMHDEKERKCIGDYVKEIGVRVYPVGRLDYMSEGLLILTNDGDFAYKLSHPKYEKEKEYYVDVYGIVDSKKIEDLKKPIMIDGKTTGKCDVKIVSKKEKSLVISMTIHEGLNREIRNICKANNLKINSLKRVRVGNLTIGELKPGEWRYLSENELSLLT